MKLILLGAPGAGKGTLATKAVDILGVPHISTGVIFRAAMSAGTPLGVKVKAIVDSGKLVDDETTIELVRERLTQDDVKNGYILDGFPRTIAQAEALSLFSVVDKVVNLNISDSVSLERLGGRLVCRKCGHNFHIINEKLKQDGVCNLCGGEIYTRDDDKAEAIEKRLEVYHVQTAPLIKYYREKKLLVDVEAWPAMEQVVLNFKHALGIK